MKDVIIITGPTAGGKTKLAHRIALSAEGEIIVADSMKVYRKADIGTSKPSSDYISEIRYHLLGVIDPGERYDVGTFYKESLNIIDSVHKDGKLLVVSGGTPLYITKLTEGLADIPAIKDETAGKLKDEDTAKLYKRLKKADPERAKNLHPNMRKRIIRALGVYLDTGKKMSVLLEETQVPHYNFIKLYIDWPREKLYERIERRVDKMFEAGLVEEVQGLLESYGESAPVFEGVGYSEVVRHLKGEFSLDAAKEEIKKNTRHYARKQLTWWRGRPLIRLSGEKLTEAGVI